MTRGAWLIARKDIRGVCTGGGVLPQSLLLGLLLIVLCGLALESGQGLGSRESAALFWLASLFCQTFSVNALYGREEYGGLRRVLLLSPMPVQAVWLGKALAGFWLLLLQQLVFGAAVLALGGQVPGPAWPQALGAIVCIDMGVAAAASLLGAVVQGQNMRESLCGVLLFPVLFPLLLAGIRTVSAGLEALPGDALLAELRHWMGIALAFDAIIAAAALILFPFVYEGER